VARPSCLIRPRPPSGPAIERFLASESTDELAEIRPGSSTPGKLSRKHPGRSWPPVELRLVKYTRGGTEYALGTTLLDRRRYRIKSLADLYHARWGIEESYRISKQFLEIEQFHGRSERLVKQELFAHFNLIAMMRLFTNRESQAGRETRQSGEPVPQANFKHSLAGLSQHLEGLLLRHTEYVSETLERIGAWVRIGWRRPRRGRSYPRRSRQPASKWARRGKPKAD